MQRIVERIEKSLSAAIENETYTPITLNDVLDFDKYVEKYGLQIEGISHEYPIYLPYTMLVVQTNEEIKSVLLLRHANFCRELLKYSVI